MEGLHLVAADAVRDFDRALGWSSSEPDVTEALNCWNLITDVTSSLQQPFDDHDDVKNALYDELFRRTIFPRSRHRVNGTRRAGRKRS
jgi:hypothetical protein